MEDLMNEMETTMDEIQYIVVKLGNEKYGIDISCVDNIVRMQHMTRVPKSQSYYVGVINLRGCLSVRNENHYYPYAGSVIDWCNCR